MARLQLTSEPADVWLPDTFIREQADQAEEQLLKAVEFRRLLQAADERLDIRWGGAPPWPIYPRWYIIRRSPQGRAFFWVIQTEEGEYCEPQERHLNRLRESDLEVNPKLWDKIMAEREAEKRRSQVAEATRHEHFRERLTEALAHIFDGHIPVTGGHKDVLEGVARDRPVDQGKTKRRLNRKEWS